MSTQPLFVEPKPVEFTRWDLIARRHALGLDPEDLAPLLGTGTTRYRTRETGAREAAPAFSRELIAMEGFVADEAAAMLAAVPSDDAIALHAVVDQDEFIAKYPGARTLRDKAPYPLTLQHVAVGRAAAEITRRGCNVEIYRGSKRADLPVRRLATGLLRKKATMYMLGVEKNHYNALERGIKPPPAGLIAELQAVDNFIDTTAGQLDVTDIGDVSVVKIIDDQDRFQQIYPHARTLRDGNPYPVRVLRVAAVRRAHQLEAAGRPTLIDAT